jgi:hypothetical protein
MRLWMLVDPGFEEAAAKVERLYASWDRVDRDWYERPYRWMMAQMAARGLDTGGSPPFWAWHSYGAPGRRVDLRTYYPVGPWVRLTLNVPDELVLLSDEVDWHAVLNNWYLSASEAEYDRIEALEDAGVLQQSEKEASWQRIFDLTQWGDPDWNGLASERYVQACTPWFEHAWIRKAERFEPHPLRGQRAKANWGAIKARREAGSGDSPS